MLSVLTLMFSCSKQELEVIAPVVQSTVGEDGPEGRVDVTFTVTLPSLNADMETNPETKALADTPTITHLYAAVFGSSGYLKEYVQASPVELATQNAPNTYAFTINLALGTGKRSVHLIANGPTTLDFDTDKVILPKLVSSNSTGAYWQVVDLPQGITAKKYSGPTVYDPVSGEPILEDGDFIDAQGHKITGSTGYIVSDETRAAFNPVETHTISYNDINGDPVTEQVTYRGIQLIRNYSKITVEAEPGSNLTVLSFAVVNAPLQGTIVPYNDLTGEFIRDYHTLSYTQLHDDLGYEGRSPIDGTYQSLATRPLNVSDFVNKTNGVVGPSGSVYFYERSAPSGDTPPTCVIVYGHYTPSSSADGTEGNYFYKVDLMESAEYYPVYRNFKYQVKIKKISKEGSDTPLDAYHSAGSGDVSADQSALELNKISDGRASLLVSPYMLRTLTGHEVDRFVGSDPSVAANQYIELKYCFVADITDANSFCNGPSGESPKGYTVVEVQNLNADLAVIKDNEIHFIKKSGNYYIIDDDDIGEDDEDHFRSILFKVNEGSAVTKNQTITITGHYDHANGSGKLYRTVKLSLINTQTMTVEVRRPRIPREKGLEQVVDVTIPRGLPKAMFPLTFAIEASANSLTPNNSVLDNNLPVESGETIGVDGSGNPLSGTSYHFNRTISYEEYLSLSGPNSSLATWSAYFYTNKALSDSRVYVAQEYFHTGYDDFVTYINKGFSDLSYVNGVPRGDDQKVTFEFYMDDEASERPDEVYVTLTGLIPNSDDYPDELTVWDSTTGTYLYHPNPANSKGTLHLYTNVDDADVRVDLRADEYDDVHFEPFEFSGVSLSDAYIGVGSTTTFSFTYPNTELRNTPVTLTLVGLEPVNMAGFESLGGNLWSYTPTGDYNSKTVNLKTTTMNGAVSVRIIGKDCKGSPAVTAARSKKTFASLTVSDTYKREGLGADITFRYQADMPAEPITVELTNLSGATPTSTTGTLTHISGDFWTYTPGSTTANATHMIVGYTSDATSIPSVQLSSETYNSISRLGVRNGYTFQSLTVSNPNLGEGQSCSVTFQYNGPSLPITIAAANLQNPSVPASSGTITDNGDGTWTFTPASDSVTGTITVTSEAVDFGSGVSATLSSESYNTMASGLKYRTVYIAANRLSFSLANIFGTPTVNMRLGSSSGSSVGSFSVNRYQVGRYTNNSPVSVTLSQNVSASDVMYFVRTDGLSSSNLGSCTLRQIVDAYSGGNYSLAIGT